MSRARHAAWLLLAALAGCGFVGRSLARNLAAPREPRKLEHKISDPRRPDARLAVLWIGHATVLVQVDDVFVLTDPVFTRTVGELSPRLVEPGLDAVQVPPLAAVLLSHMHFDHLSYDSLDMLEHKTNVVLVPPGVRSVMPRYSTFVLCSSIRRTSCWCPRAYGR